MEEKSIRKLQENIVMQNCFISVFPQMMENPDKQFYKFMRDYTRENYTATALAVRETVAINLLKEILVLINQVWKTDSEYFDERLIKQKNVFNVIKNKMSKDGKPLPFNTKEIYKRVREAIAHNSETNPNFVYNLRTFELNLGKVNGTDYIVELELSELYNLLNVLLLNKQDVCKYTIAYNDDNDILTREDVKKSIAFVQSGKSDEIELDNYQAERVYNFFTYIAEVPRIGLYNNFMSTVLTMPDDPESLLNEKIKALFAVSALKSNGTFNEIKQTVTALKQNVYLISARYAIVSNLLFTIASSRTNAEIEEMLADTELNLSSEDVRHFRNALCHGRYFHDYRNAFYFYDGKKNLEFKLKLTIDQVYEMLGHLAKGLHTIKAVGKKRLI